MILYTSSILLGIACMLSAGALEPILSEGGHCMGAIADKSLLVQSDLSCLLWVYLTCLLHPAEY